MDAPSLLLLTIKSEFLPDEPPIVQPPSSAQVDMERRPVLWLPDGRMLVRTIGFRTK